VVPNPSKDAELEASLAGAQEAFAHFSDESWLSWGAILLPHLVKEAEERQKRAKEEEELAKVAKERAEREERAKDRRARLEAGMQRWIDDAISADEWTTLEAEIKAERLADGEAEVEKADDTKRAVEAMVVDDPEEEGGFSIEDAFHDSPRHTSPLLLGDEQRFSPSSPSPPPRPKPTLRKKAVPTEDESPLRTKSEGKRKRENTPEIVDVDADPLDRGNGRSRRSRPLAMMKATGIPRPDLKTSGISLRNVEGPVSKPSIPIILFANCLLSATVVPVTRR
jgi:hypothetical protein